MAKKKTKVRSEPELENTTGYTVGQELYSCFMGKIERVTFRGVWKAEMGPMTGLLVKPVGEGSGIPPTRVQAEDYFPTRSAALAVWERECVKIDRQLNDQLLELADSIRINAVRLHDVREEIYRWRLQEAG